MATTAASACLRWPAINARPPSLGTSDWTQRRRSTEQRTRRLIHQLEQLGHTVTIAAAT